MNLFNRDLIGSNITNIFVFVEGEIIPDWIYNYMLREEPYFYLYPYGEPRELRVETDIAVEVNNRYMLDLSFEEYERLKWICRLERRDECQD